MCNKCCPKPRPDPFNTNNKCCIYIDCDDKCEDPEDFYGKRKDFCNDCCLKKGTYHGVDVFPEYEEHNSHGLHEGHNSNINGTQQGYEENEGSGDQGCCQYINCHDVCEDEYDFTVGDDAYLCNECCVINEHRNHDVECEPSKCETKCDDPDDFVHPDDDVPFCNKCCPKPDYKDTNTANQCCKYIDCDAKCEDAEDFNGKNKDFCNDCCLKNNHYYTTTSISKDDNCCKYINCYEECEDDDDFADGDEAYLCNQCCSHCKVGKEHNRDHNSTTKPAYPVEGNHITTITNSQCCKSRVVDQECCKFIDCNDRCDDYDDFVDVEDAHVCNTCCSQYKPGTNKSHEPTPKPGHPE